MRAVIPGTWCGWVLWHRLPMKLAADEMAELEPPKTWSGLWVAMLRCLFGLWESDGCLFLSAYEPQSLKGSCFLGTRSTLTLFLVHPPLYYSSIIFFLSFLYSHCFLWYGWKESFQAGSSVLQSPEKGEGGNSKTKIRVMVTNEIDEWDKKGNHKELEIPNKSMEEKEAIILTYFASVCLYAHPFNSINSTWLLAEWGWLSLLCSV